MIDAPAPHDAAHLRDLGDVARGEASALTAAALMDWARMLALALIYGDIDGDTYLDNVEEWMGAVALLEDETMC